MAPTHHPYTRRVASNVKAELTRAGKLQKQLGFALGQSPEWTSKRLRGEVPLDTNDLARIAEFLEIPVAQLTIDEQARA